MTNSNTRALLDNSAFAGVMRLLKPTIEQHQRFLALYPEHRAVDQASLADFLSALCLYDDLVLESSSQVTGSQSHSWVEEMKSMLPAEVAKLVEESTSSSFDEDEEDSIKRAFDVMTSPLRSSLELPEGAKIPNVYYAQDYAYREAFCDLNKAAGSLLNDDELARAMFMHRGLFLQSWAHRANCVYIPYGYRGAMLSQLPPMTWAPAPHDGFVEARLPLAQGSRPHENDYIKQLNEYYYSLLQSVTWVTYDSTVPFIGAAILAASGGHPERAMDLALKYRQNATLRSSDCGTRQRGPRKGSSGL
jgi:hypothetical protein